MRGFVLTGTSSQSTADSLAILDRHWTDMVATMEDRAFGPWMYAVTLGGVREIDLG